MRIELTNRRALVSGSTTGIGFAIALGLARTGAEVVVNGRNASRVETAVANILEDVKHCKVRAFVGDLADAATVDRLKAEHPELDILVNNIGGYEIKGFFEISDSDWLDAFETNVLSGARLSRLYARGMASRNWGRIVFISSESGVQVPTDMVHYGASKAAQLAVARGLAETLAGSGVTVNSLLPGATRTEGMNRLVSEMATAASGVKNINVQDLERHFLRRLRPSSLIRRFAAPEEIANMAVYLCSEQASATTGAALRVDGGAIRAVV